MFKFSLWGFFALGLMQLMGCGNGTNNADTQQGYQGGFIAATPTPSCPPQVQRDWNMMVVPICGQSAPGDPNCSQALQNMAMRDQARFGQQGCLVNANIVPTGFCAPPRVVNGQQGQAIYLDNQVIQQLIGNNGGPVGSNPNGGFQQPMPVRQGF